MKRNNLISKIILFYVEGFKNMSWWGKQLWLIILLKLFIVFGILKVFFFPNPLETNFTTDSERSEHVIEQLINKVPIDKPGDNQTINKNQIK